MTTYRAHVNYIRNKFGHRAAVVFDADTALDARDDAHRWINDQPTILWAVVSPPFVVKE